MQNSNQYPVMIKMKSAMPLLLLSVAVLATCDNQLIMAERVFKSTVSKKYHLLD